MTPPRIASPAGEEAAALPPLSLSGTTPPSRVTLIEPPRRWPSLNWRELIDARGLFWFLVWRDIKIRYAQTAMGVAWAVLQPVLTMAIFALVFGRIVRVPSGDHPYWIMALTALTPWFYYATALMMSSASLVGNANLLTKTYFPRLTIPIAPVVAGLMDLAIAVGLLLFVMSFRGLPNPWMLLLLPALALHTAVAAAGLGLLLGAMNVRYRDVKYVVPFLLQLQMYMSPIAYPLSLIPERWHLIYSLNPMVGVVEGFRFVFLGSTPLARVNFAVSVGVAVVVFVIGILYFRQTEDSFADVV